MKKFLALLFVCAGLTAMAATPHVNRTNITKAKTPMVMKQSATNSVAAQFTAPAMNEVSASLTNHVRNQVNTVKSNVARKAPLRLSAADILEPHMAFMDLYDWSFNDGAFSMEPAMPGFAGGWTLSMSETDTEGRYNSDGLYYVFNQPFDVYLEDGIVTMPVFETLYTAEVIGTARTRTDTIMEVWMVPESWFTGDETTEYNDIIGSILTDGSFAFLDEGFAYVFEEIHLNYRNYTLQSTDTVVEASAIMKNCLMMVPNGTHSYTWKNSNTGAITNSQNDVYVFQANDTVVNVMNLWSFGYTGNQFILYPNNVMKFPLQFCDEDDMTDFNEQYPGYEFGTSFYNFIQNGDISEDDTYGLVNETMISWSDTTLVADVFTYNGNTYYPGVAYPAMWNNVINLTKGQLVLPTDEPVGLRGDVNDDQAVDIQDVTSLIDFLLSGDFDSVNYDNSDCNLDGTVDISDVTVLIDYLLNGVWSE